MFTVIIILFFIQGLNPGKAIAEVKKMLFSYQTRKAAAA